MSSNNVSSNWENITKGIVLLSVAATTGNFNTRGLQHISQMINDEGADTALKQLTEGEQYGPAIGRGDYVSNTDDLRYFDSFTEDYDIAKLNNDRKEALETDKRVSLTVRPRIYNVTDDSFVERVKKILSTNKTSTDGILYKALGNSFGIIFPYTPIINGFGKTVSYETVQIPHSNLSFNQYKNTSSNDISLKAKFTADNRKNALSMISSIWFLNACSSSKFGKNDDEAGLPPPVLYLNGYDDMIDNIPVVISSFDYNLDDKSQYVKLIVSSNGEIIEELEKKKTDDLIYWLPTELDISIKLKIQPNVRKVYDEWSLDKYKKGDLFGISSKSNSKYIPSGWTW